MTTIKSAYSSKTLKVQRPLSTPGGCLLEISYYNGDLAGSVNVPLADLLAALDATANTDVKHRADAYEAATSAEQERDEYRLKAVVIDAERDDWKARAEKAEATVAAVRAWRYGEEQFDTLDAILNPKPAFTLPTEAGAIIIASEIRMDHGPNMQGTLMLGHGGLWYGQTAPVSGGVLGIHERIHPDQIIEWKPDRVVAEDAS